MSRRRTGKMGVGMGLVCGGAALVLAGLSAVLLITNLSGSLSAVEGALDRAWMLGPILAFVVGLLVGLVAWLRGMGIGSRITELGLAVAKLRSGGCCWWLARPATWPRARARSQHAP